MRTISQIIFVLLFASLCAFSGVVIVTSTPSNSTIIVNNVSTGVKTPDTLRLTEEMAMITVKNREYQFERRTILLGKDDTLHLSFTHLEMLDTISIVGDKQYGILNLPAPPVPIPFLIDEFIEKGNDKILLPPGEHRIVWDGGIPYYPIDTVIMLAVGEITSPDIQFKQRFGALEIKTNRDSSLIYLDDSLIGIGKTRRPVAAGHHTISANLTGFLSDSITTLVLPGKTREISLELFPSRDKDGDGFLDSIDLCVEEYGVYGGCPSISKRNEMKKISSFLGKHFIYQPFTIQLSLVSYMRRIAYDKSTKELLNFYNDGAPLFNNYRGFQALNKLWLGASFFLASAEYGQSFYGLHYNKTSVDPTNNSSYHVDFDGGDSLFLAAFEYETVHPTAHIQSGTFQGGVRFNFSHLTFALLTGYHIETIVYKNLYKIDPVTDDYSTVTIEEKNNVWMTTAHVGVAFSTEPMIPRLYLEADFSSHNAPETGWAHAEIGFFIPFTIVRKQP